MSIIFGLRKPMDQRVTQEDMLVLARATERYAVDGGAVDTASRIGMGFQPYHTHQRSRLEQQPLSDGLGNMLALDGRLDNRFELCTLLALEEDGTADSLIVLAGFRKWGEGVFAKMVGDWALSLWSAAEETLYLARDHAGTRTLYFREINGVCQWSTYLETFFAEGEMHALEPRYAACYLGNQPCRNLTPYKGILAVPPAHFVAIRETGTLQTAHWQWMKQGKTSASTDVEYEQEFLRLFRQAVDRRTGPGAPILAQLSGGMDSTSIVCMSDLIRASQTPSVELLDTISFYDDAEPNWNEKPYFSAVERLRGKSGIHLRLSFMSRSFEMLDPAQGSYMFPGGDSSAIEWEKTLDQHLSPGGYRSILSGIGGDEVLGGVPTSLPELSGYLVGCQFNKLLTQAFSWCLVDRTPFLYLLLEVLRFTASLYRPAVVDQKTIPRWLTKPTRDQCLDVAQAHTMLDRRFGFSPAAISNGLTWWFIMETLPNLDPSILTRHEYRYPYLDRDLVDFLFTTPRDQLVRPGRRRSLMRRALKDIVPSEILERRRKAFSVRGPLLFLQESEDKITMLFAKSLLVEYGLVDSAELLGAVKSTIAGGNPQWWPAIVRAISFELWLQSSLRKLALVPATPETVVAYGKRAIKFHADQVVS